ncbi:MAG: elongation factor P, partial [Brevundimonas sp.]
MKINGNTIKPGMVLQHNGGLWVVTKASHVKPGKGGAFANVEAKNLETGN